MQSTNLPVRFLLAVALAATLGPAQALAQESSEPPQSPQTQTTDIDTVKSITAVRIEAGTKIDGVLDEPFWRKAPRSGDFTQYQPNEGEPASESTFVRVAYDDDALYIGMEMYDSEPDKIINRLTRRDRWVEGDVAHIMLDSHHDHQTAYCFSLFASGTQRDVYYYNDTWSDDTWDAVWDGATQITDKGWTAEFKIPFHCLRFSCGNGEPVWGFYASRGVSRKNELDRWKHIPDSAGGFVSQFGHLKGLAGLLPPERLELRPYAVSYAEAEPKSLGNPDGRDYTSNFGFDAKYGLTSSLTLDATINPDFGQVEADQTILDLSTFETWYPEKRPFFMEGNKIFETYYTLFYSRRIGAPPSVWFDEADYYINRPAATTILGAAKVSGKTSGGTSIGILESVTQREETDYVDENGVRRHGIIEPRANYLVTRVKQDVFKNSEIGIMATSVSQKGRDPKYTGGADWNLRFKDGDYKLMGQVVGSRTAPDEDGWGGMLLVEKSGGENFRGSVRGEYRDRGLNLNRLGYLNRADLREGWGGLQYRTTGKRWIINKTWNNLNLGVTDNLSGVELVRGGNFNNMVEFTNFWMAGMYAWTDFEKTYSDLETRGGPPAPIPIGKSWSLWVETNSRKWWMVHAEVSAGDTWDGRYNSYHLWLQFQPRSNVELSIGPSYRRHWGASRWLTYLEDAEGNRTDEIFGEQSLDRLDATIRGTVTFTKNLTLQLYAQPFFAAVDYKNFKRLIPPDSYEYVDDAVYNEEVEQPDYNWTSFNSNLILRWEYRPGSTLYLVWTQARESFRSIGDFQFDRDWDNLFGTGPNNTFLIKFSYWWSL
ncbi:MAG: carbohydrate binding family 9 domain-containing protein [Candidatus Eiseniibacteriota bacterium]|nr:MAG: carbohydrate binding family 9 domain-containing protein [Candidatus Eisenbacteria bacterium]